MEISKKMDACPCCGSILVRRIGGLFPFFGTTRKKKYIFECGSCGHDWLG
jgi:ribosomal protein L37AE/L43A